MNTCLTIAGSDCSGGAGIQADLKAMLANGVYGMSVITALTSQNTTGVMDIMEVSTSFLASQLDAVFKDIFPDSVKIGMLANAALIEVIADKLKGYNARKIVLDPVMVATSGARLIQESAISALTTLLFPLADLITPNIPEAQILSAIDIKNADDMMAAAKCIVDKYKCAVLIKGGHDINDANDLLVTQNSHRWFKGKRIDNPNTHGTGCTLSSAIASNLAKGEGLENAIERGKKYVSSCLAAMLDLGKGRGPMSHGSDLKSEFIN